MITSFLTDGNQETTFLTSLSSYTEQLPHRESVRLLVIGSRKGINNIIQSLHKVGFAEVGEWSPLLPGPNPGELMSILTRSIITN